MSNICGHAAWANQIPRATHWFPLGPSRILLKKKQNSTQDYSQTLWKSDHLRNNRMHGDDSGRVIFVKGNLFGSLHSIKTQSKGGGKSSGCGICCNATLMQPLSVLHRYSNTKTCSTKSCIVRSFVSVSAVGVFGHPWKLKTTETGRGLGILQGLTLACGACPVLAGHAGGLARTEQAPQIKTQRMPGPPIKANQSPFFPLHICSEKMKGCSFAYLALPCKPHSGLLCAQHLEWSVWLSIWFIFCFQRYQITPPETPNS